MSALPLVVAAFLTGQADLEKTAARIVRQTNEYREQKELKPVEKNRKLQKAAQYFADYLADQVARKRAHPQDDMISALTRQHYQALDRRLTDDEIYGIVYFMILGGLETTQYALEEEAQLLCDQPALFSALRSTPEKIRAFTEEAMRLRAPTQGLSTRVTTRDEDIIVEVPGQDQKAFEEIKDIIRRTARLEFKMVDDKTMDPGRLSALIQELEEKNSLKHKEGEKFSEYVAKLNGFAKGRIPEGTEIAFERVKSAPGTPESEAGRIPYLLFSKVELSGGELQDAHLGINPEDRRPEVQFKLKPRGAALFDKLTGENVGHAAGAGAAVGAAGGAVLGGVKGGTHDAEDARAEIMDDFDAKSLENRAVAPGQIAYGFLFFPGEAPSARMLRLQLIEEGTQHYYTLTFPLS